MSGPLETPRLEATGLSKRYKGRVVLDDVGFSVAQGELVAILGPSGAGKTTLFRCLTGLTAPDEGSVRIGGAAVTKDAGRARRRVAIVFQHYNLVGRLSTLDNVLAGRLGHVSAWRGITRRFSRRDRLLALDCLDRVGLLSFATARADTLSGGQQQRVAIARALAQSADVIIADEPIASLDPTAAAGVLDLLRGIALSDGVGVVCSLHQTHFARSHSDRIVGLAQGRVVFDGPADAFDEAAAIRLYATPISEPDPSLNPTPRFQDIHP
ncbi:phosphonate ABC transporter ATP-binding protein [Beijerinckia sp. L45]|uniref:phosphonate ABC transporter ATP-binding protein n=1 Tax=Beijerinckia sp. L45 TaxID=1641855 RepID=UPI00131AFBFE|nr:phosphonate ABC transporter ATP-binding protein [Beijerinckia sp. L45]